jgi:hypothetical protein
MSDTLPDMARFLSVSSSDVPRTPATGAEAARVANSRSRALALAALTLAIATTLPIPALAWGAMGHRLVAALAADELSPAARTEVTRLLEGEPDPSLPGVASWADDLREHDPDLGRRSSRWHYVNLGEAQCSYDAARDCKGGNCVVEAIAAQAAVLGDRTRTNAERAQALKFVVHFVGDVHQPLHAGYAHDKGGNTVQVSIDGKGTNLHSLWDSKLLASAALDESAYLQRLRALPVVVPMPVQVLPPDSADWARQSCAIATQPGVYPPSTKLPEGYADLWRPVAEERLRRAATQLALLLNATLVP